MMKHTVIFFIAFVSVTYCSAQFNFKFRQPSPLKIDFVASNTDDVLSNIFIEKDRVFDSTYNLDQDYDFEFRLWQDGLSNNSQSVFIMTFKKDKWSAKYFHFNWNRKESEKELVEVKVDSSKLNQLWYLMNYHKVLSLPNSNQLSSKMVEYVIDTVNFEDSYERRLDITDGIGYNFELLKPNKRRSYFYSNPEPLFKRYPFIEELSDATVLIYMIRKYLGIPINHYFY